MSPNDIVKIKPTDYGWVQIVKYVNDTNNYIRSKHPNATFRLSVPEQDNKGYIKDQFWVLMRYFDWTNGISQDLPFTDLKLPKQD